MTDDENPWGFLPDEWPVIGSEREYEAFTMMLAGFNDAIGVVPAGDLRRALLQSADGLRLRVRTWELDHGIEPPPPLR